MTGAPEIPHFLIDSLFHVRNVRRMYGTSEYQITEALYQLMQENFVKREDFIFQTKLVAAETKSFAKSWDATWANVGEKLGYIDLLSVHAVADNDEKLEETMTFLQQVKEEQKIKFIGFATHGSSEQIMDLINTEQVRDKLANIFHWKIGHHHES